MESTVFGFLALHYCSMRLQYQSVASILRFTARQIEEEEKQATVVDDSITVVPPVTVAMLESAMRVSILV